MEGESALDTIPHLEESRGIEQIHYSALGMRATNEQRVRASSLSAIEGGEIGTKSMKD